MKKLLWSNLALLFIFAPIILNGATAIQLVESGLAIVQVSGGMVGTGSLIAIDNKIYVLTPSHLIQNTITPNVSIKNQFLDAMFTDNGEIRHFKKILYQQLVFLLESFIPILWMISQC